MVEQAARTARTNDMTGAHIVKAYDDELEQLNGIIVKMGGLAEAQIARAIESLVKRHPDLAEQVIRDDDKVDELNYEVDMRATRLLALRQPMAMDLRNVVATLKISSDLERIADYAANVARRAITLSESAPLRPVQAIPRMGRFAQQMLKDALDAYVSRDVEKALAVWHSDASLDDRYTSFFRELLTYMMEDPRNITPCTHLLFCAKNIERIGDHITNISETIYFLVNGTRLRAERPRGGQRDHRFPGPQEPTKIPE
jgi:phosphate transport system protein